MRQEVGQQLAGVLDRVNGGDCLDLRLTFGRREVEVHARQVAAEAADLFATRRHDIVPSDERLDGQFSEEAGVAGRRPDRVEGAFDLEPVESHAGSDVLRGAPGDLSDAQSVPRNRNGVEDDGLMGIEPGDDFAFLGLHGRRREGGEQAAAFLLLAFFVGAQDGGLGRFAGVRSSVGPAEAPDRQTQAVIAGVDRRDVHRGLITGQIGIKQADGAPALGDGGALHPLASFSQIGPLMADVALLVLEATADRQGGVGLLVLQQYELSMGEISAELEQPRGIDAFLVDARRGALRGDGDVEGFLDGFLIGRQVSGRQIKSAADLVVAGHAAVGRQQRGDVQPREREQVLERVLEFLARQPA